MDFQIFDPAVIPSEGPTLDAIRVLLKHEMLMASQKCQTYEAESNFTSAAWPSIDSGGVLGTSLSPNVLPTGMALSYI